MNKIQRLLADMWDDYCNHNPGAQHLHNLLIQEGEVVINDHIALRTLSDHRINIKVLSRVFLEEGYKECDSYIFKEKNLAAKYFKHPDPSLPKIFISQLELQKMSPFVQDMLTSMVDQIPDRVFSSDHFAATGGHWQITKAAYDYLAGESEYAAWFSAWGFRANHFTVSVNHLQKYKTVQAVNDFIESSGYLLNAAGGKIKGTPKDYLEQSSTMAELCNFDFYEGSFKIPGCFYEFALRYPMPDGTLFQGFVPASANKIFESTNH